jgi:hypothetical protein
MKQTKKNEVSKRLKMDRIVNYVNLILLNLFYKNIFKMINKENKDIYCKT